MARGGIRLVHGHTKSTLITYFSGMKIYPNYAFLKAFFLICPSCPFQNKYIWPKTHPFFQFCTFLPPLNAVRAYSAWSWKTTLITWIFGRAWYPPWHSSGPPGAKGTQIGRGGSRIFLKEGAPTLRVYRTLAPVWTGVSKGDVPPSEAKKNCNFQSQFPRFGTFFLPGAPT